MSTRFKTVGALAATVVLWASAYPGIRFGLQAYSPSSVALLIFLCWGMVLAGLVLVGVCPLPRWPSSADVPYVFGIGGTSLAAYHGAICFGEVTVTAGAASFLATTAPIFAALMAAFFLSERITWLGWLGMIVCLIGAAIISFGETGEAVGVAGPRGEAFFGYGPLTLLFSAVAGAAYFTIQKPYLHRYSSHEINCYSVGTASLLFLWALPSLATEMQKAPWAVTFAPVYVGVLPAGIGYVIYSYAISRLQVARVTNVLFLVPLVSLPISWIWLGEVPSLSVVAGGILTLGGIVLVQKRGTRQKVPT